MKHICAFSQLIYVCAASEALHGLLALQPPVMETVVALTFWSVCAYNGSSCSSSLAHIPVKRSLVSKPPSPNTDLLIAPPLPLQSTHCSNWSSSCFHYSAAAFQAVAPRGCALQTTCHRCDLTL